MTAEAGEADKAPGTLRSLLMELQRRRVVRAATLYVVILWPVIQIVDILSPALGLPDAAMRWLVLGFVAGLPPVLLLAWLFDLNRGGVDRTGGDGAAPARALIGPRSELAIIAVMTALVGVLFWLQHSVDFGEADSQSTAPLPNSVAVLPFEPFSGSDRDRYFADGLTEELLNVLTRVEGLRVSARTSSFAYRGVNRPVQEIARELNVEAVLEGSVRRSDVDDRIRITAQLIDGRSGVHLFSLTFDRRFADVFRIQDDIAAAVRSELQLTWLAGVAPQRSRDASSPEAVIAYGMGLTELAKRTEQGMADAARFFERALIEDPGYAAAWVGLADALTLRAAYGYGEKAPQLERAREAVDHALELDDASGMAWASRGLQREVEGDYSGARAALEKALKLNGSYPMAHMWYAGLVDGDERLQHYEAARRLDPKSAVAGYNVAVEYINRGRTEDAMALFGEIIEADPDYGRAYQLVGRVSFEGGRPVEAIRHFERAYALTPSPDIAGDLADLHVLLGSFEAADTWIARAREAARPWQASRLALFDVRRLAMQGEIDASTAVLESLVEPAGASTFDRLVAVFAAYYVEDWQATVDNWALFEADLDAGTAVFDKELYDFARLAVAYALRQLDRETEATPFLDAVRERLDRILTAPGAGDDDWYNYTLLQAMDGNRTQALAALQRAIDAGWLDYWRPSLEPALSAMAEDPLLGRMTEGVAARVAVLRSSLESESDFEFDGPGASIGG